MKKLLLVHPVNKKSTSLATNRHSKIPPLGLGIVASLTPKNWEVEIIDENFDDFVFKDCDLVGITAFTTQANRAYQIAKICRENGVKVVMGGIHATIMREEALKFVDTIVTNEAESVWGQLIEDFENGKLKKEYNGQWLSLDNQIKARHELFHKDYYFGAIQTTRGCPYNCSFCSVSIVNGKKHRYRPINDVLDELELVNRKMIYFVDDNLVGNTEKSRARAKELFKGIIDRKLVLEYSAQVDINFADDDEVLEYAAKSGCKIVFIGLESDKEDVLKDLNKNVNIKKGPKNYNKVIKKINKYGITVMGGVIVGFDSDSYKDVYNRGKYLIKSSVNCMAISCLTPFPGTKVYNDMLAENRILVNDFPKDWEKFDLFHPVFKPKKMTAEELSSAFEKTIHKVFSMWVIYRKYYKFLLLTRNKLNSSWLFYSNIHMREAVYGHYKKIKKKNEV